MTNQRRTDESTHPGPALLSPRDGDADLAPLFDTLAQVALAIAQRRATPSDRTDTGASLNVCSSYGTLDRVGRTRVMRARRPLLRRSRRKSR